MKLKKLCIFFMIITIVILASTKTNASFKIEGIENFPESYKPYLRELEKKYPRWSFTALYTNLDWNYVISEESKFGVNLVPKNYSDRWKNKTPGQYNVEVDSGWVDSSKQAVEYCMDPRNFLNQARIFQFETLSYNSNTNNLNSIEKILYGTEFYKRKVSYLTSSGNTINMSETYSDLILRAGQISKVSPYHLASRIKQEVGPFLTHKSISGNVEGYKGLYNFYNIGATSSSEPLGAIKKGLQYALNGKGASEETKSKYLIPWNTKEKAITGGAIFIGSSYINIGQNTVYLQKFNVNNDRPSTLFSHQYMTNVLAPYGEALSIYNGYQKMGLLDTPMSFVIPIYNNMPEIPADSPNIDKSNFTTDNTRVYCNATNVNIRTGPSTSYEAITMVSYPSTMTRILKSTNSGDKWDKVILDNGIVGYIYETYVTPKIEIEKIDLTIDNTTLKKGEKGSLSVTISPLQAKDNKVEFISSNPNIITVDNQGNLKAIHSGTATITVKAVGTNVKNKIDLTVYSSVTDIGIDYTKLSMAVGDVFKINAYVEPDDANNPQIIYRSSDISIATVDEEGNIYARTEGQAIIYVISQENPDIKRSCLLNVVRKMDESEISFDNQLEVNSLEISGINYKKNTVKDLKKLITTNLQIEIVDNKYQPLKDTDIVGTGYKILVKEQEYILREYTIIVYGDVNGDGRINSIDLLVLQRHILEIEQIQGVYKKAGNVRKVGNKPSSVDLLLIQRHILGLKSL